MNAFCPGVLSQVNSCDEHDNVYLPQNYFFDDGIDDDIGARSRYIHGGLEAKTEITAGSELFLWYGSRYHEYQRHVQLTAGVEFETLEEFKSRYDFSKLPTEQDKRNLLNTTSMRLRDDMPFIEREESLGAEWLRYRTFNKTIRKPPKEKPSRSIEWLSQNGICIDNLYMTDSTIPGAGSGAFTKHAIITGSIVSHAPLLHLKRDDLVIYGLKDSNGGSDNNINKKKVSSHLLDFNKVEGHELLLNYCYGHPDSELLLVPYAPIVSFINHDGKNPNTMIRWAQDVATPYFDLHPIEVLEKDGGTLRMEFVAIRDIAPDEEITINYGSDWQDAWKRYKDQKKSGGSDEKFRHAIGVPDDFYPEKWLHTSIKYEVEPRGDLKPGELQPYIWKHNGKPITKRQAYHVGLPKGFSERMKNWADNIGIMQLYGKLLASEDMLKDDTWFVFNATKKSTGAYAGEWFAQRFKTGIWGFNMHYAGAWNEFARLTILGELGRAGFDQALDGVGTTFGLDSLTCYQVAFMGVSRCDTSFTHTDVYASGGTSYNIIFPLELVEGSKPELNLLADDANTIISVHYEYDTALLMGEWGYHFTSAIDGYTGDQKRVVLGLYCGQIDESNRLVAAHIYDGEDPQPFMGQFDLPIEKHWSKGNPMSDRLSRFQPS
jgi:hypothetical protein